MISDTVISIAENRLDIELEQPSGSLILLLDIYAEGPVSHFVPDCV